MSHLLVFLLCGDRDRHRHGRHLRHTRGMPHWNTRRGLYRVLTSTILSDTSVKEIETIEGLISDIGKKLAYSSESLRLV
jgi:hypothetical protein